MTSKLVRRRSTAYTLRYLLDSMIILVGQWLPASPFTEPDHDADIVHFACRMLP